MENRVCENQETTIMRAFEFRKEGLVSSFRRKTTSVGRCLSGQNETSGIILSFIKYLFPIYMDKDIKETDVCFVVSVCVRSDGNWELTALRDCR